jgi:hypothetical protein
MNGMKRLRYKAQLLYSSKAKAIIMDSYSKIWGHQPSCLRLTSPAWLRTCSPKAGTEIIAVGVVWPLTPLLLQQLLL